MRLVSWKRITKGNLRGFATVELPIGLKFVDCPVFVSNGKAWATLPGKPLIDKEGRQKTDVNGKSAYVSILEWRDRALSTAFSDRVVELVRTAHPKVFEERAL
jgi:hypothetical protein